MFRPGSRRVGHRRRGRRTSRAPRGCRRRLHSADGNPGWSPATYRPRQRQTGAHGEGRAGARRYRDASPGRHRHRAPGGHADPSGRGGPAWRPRRSRGADQAPGRPQPRRRDWKGSTARDLPDRRSARRRKQPERIEIRVAAARVPDAEVQMRLGGRAPAAGSHGADALSEPYPIALTHRGGGEVQVGGVVAPVASADREGEPGRSRAAREPHPARRGREDRGAVGGGHVDPAMLSGCVGVAPVAIERDDLAGHRPGPARRCGRHTGLAKRGAQGARHEEQRLHQEVAGSSGHGDNVGAAGAPGPGLVAEASWARACL